MKDKTGGEQVEGSEWGEGIQSFSHLPPTWRCSNQPTLGRSRHWNHSGTTAASPGGGVCK